MCRGSQKEPFCSGKSTTSHWRWWLCLHQTAQLDTSSKNLWQVHVLIQVYFGSRHISSAPWCSTGSALRPSGGPVLQQLIIMEMKVVLVLGVSRPEALSERASVLAYRESCVVFLIFANLKLAWKFQGWIYTLQAVTCRFGLWLSGRLPELWSVPFESLHFCLWQPDLLVYIDSCTLRSWSLKMWTVHNVK